MTHTQTLPADALPATARPRRAPRARNDPARGRTRVCAALAMVAAGVLCDVRTLRAQSSPPAGPADLTRQQELVFRSAWQAAARSIVRIDTIGGAQPLEKIDAIPGEERTAVGFRQADGPTTGVVWSPDGWIVTSSFNFYRDPTVTTVTLADGRRFVATLVARDLPARIALLKIPAAGLTCAEPTPTTDIKRGQWVLTAGMGYGSAAPAISVGIVSAAQRFAGIALQTDAKTSPANYGGPLIDLQGRTLGICVPLGAGEDVTAGLEWYDSGIGFAICSEFLQQRIPLMQSGRTLERALLGVSLASAEPVEEPLAPVGAPASAPAAAPRAGVRIVGPTLGPAAAAGLLEGDVITALDDQPVRIALDFRRVMVRKVPGDAVEVSYERAGAPLRAGLRAVSASELRALPAAEARPPPATLPSPSQP